MKTVISLKVGAISLAAALAMSSAVAYGKNVSNVGKVGPGPAHDRAMQREINLSHLNFLESTVPYPASPVNGLSTFDPGQPLSVWYTYANYDAQTTQYTRVGSGSYDATTNTWGQGESALDDISRAVIVYLKHYEAFHDTASLDRAVAGLRTICYLQDTTGPDAGNFYDWIEPTGSPNLTVDNDSSFNWWGARALWALTEGYGVLQSVDPTEAAYLKTRIDLAMNAIDQEVTPLYNQFDTIDGLKSPEWLIEDGSDASSVAVLGLVHYYQLTGSATAKRLADMLAAGIADLHAGSGASWPYGGFLDYSQSFSLWHGYGSNQVEALAVAGEVLNHPTWITAAEAGAASLLVHVSVAYGPDIEGLEPGPTDPSQIAYGATSLFQDYLTLGEVTHSKPYLEMAGVALGWYFGENDGGYPMYNPANGVTFDGINTNGTLNQNSGAESTIEGLMALEDAAENPSIQSFIPDGPALAESLPLTLPANDGTLTDGKVVTPSSAWTGQGQFTDGSYVVLQPGGQDVLYSDLPVPGTDVVQVEASPDSVPETVNVAIGGQSSTIEFPAVAENSSSAPVYLAIDSASAVTPVYQGLDPVTLSLPSTATQPLVIDSVTLQPALEWDTWPTASGNSITVLKNMSDISQTWNGVSGVTVPAYGFDVLVQPTTRKS